MKPFLFSRGQNHYVRFFVPTSLREHFGKKYLTFALGMGAGHELRLKAHQLESYLTIECNKLLHNRAMNFDPSRIGKLDIILRDGTQLKNINNDEDMRRAQTLLQAISQQSPAQPFAQVVEAPSEAPKPVQKGLKLIGLVDKFFLLKSHLKPATASAYRNCMQEFQDFLKNPNITSVMVSDVSRFQEHLAKNKNTARTIDNKTSVLRSLFNFAIKQGHYFEKNPAEDRALLTKKQKIAGGWEKFDLEEIKLIFTSQQFRKEKERDPDFYYICILALVSGCRIGELSTLKVTDIKKTAKGTEYISIKDAKTLAGIRNVPVHLNFIDEITEFIASRKTEQLFKYLIRDGKGAGNAAGKKFSRLLETLNIKREKLVFHSLRKFLNDFLLKADVPYEPRCQFIGHEIDDTNVAMYSKEYSEDELYSYVQKSQVKIIVQCNLVRTKL